MLDDMFDDDEQDEETEEVLQSVFDEIGLDLAGQVRIFFYIFIFDISLDNSEGTHTSFLFKFTDEDSAKIIS